MFTRRSDLRAGGHWLGWLWLSATLYAAELKLPAVLSDRAILQAETLLPIWGAADPGERLTIAIGDGHYETTADAAGHWSLTLAPLRAGVTPLTLTVLGKAGRRLEIHDLLAGEVWLAAGQSNVAMSVAAAGEKALRPGESWVENVRFFHDGGWRTLAGVSDVEKLSAIGWAFARRLARERRGPVGLIVAARGGTRIEAWMGRDALNQTADGRAMNELADRPEVRAAAAVDARISRPYDKTELYRWRLGRALPTSLYATLIEPLGRYALRGVLWYQGESNASRMEDAVAYADHLELLVIGWRAQFARTTLPFLIVQLPRYDQPPAEGGLEPWLKLRASQQVATARLNDVWLVDAFDLGDPSNIHPRHKTELGFRLADRAVKLSLGPP